MKVLLVNTYDRGGAGKACIRLHRGLLNQDVNSKILFKSKTDFTIPESFQYSKPVVKKTIVQKLAKKSNKILKEFYIFTKEDKSAKQKKLFLNSRNRNLEMFSFPDSGIDITTDKNYQQADVVHFHWVADFIDYSDFFKNNNKVVVWTLHDMNPFTGGEHYQEIYCGIDKNGKPIFRQLNNEEIAMFSKILKLKMDALQKVENLHIVVLCNWMADQIKNSALLSRFPISIIPNGIDSNIFKPLDKKFSRNLLGFPLDKIVLLFVADSVKNYRKGYEYLLRAFELIDKTEVVLCSVGQKNTELINSDTFIELGAINDERLMSVIYSAADAFIIPSLMDNLPNTVVESLLCGTPVVGFPVGGLTDLIQNGENGYLADDISVDSLVSSINKFLINKNLFDSESIVKNARKKYDLNVMSNNYIDLYKRIYNE